MPLRLHFPLRGSPPAHSFQHMTGLRALVLKWLDAANPSLAEEMHDRGRVKPYAISPIWNEGGRLSFELSLLDDGLLGPLAAGLSQCKQDIRLGSQWFHLLQPEIVETATWEQIISIRPANDSIIDLQLITPTAHHAAASSCRKSVVLPSPELYFGSWLNRWNAYAPSPLPDTILEIVADRVAIGACAGGTQVVKLDRSRSFIGFEGTVRFCILKYHDLPPQELQALWTLTRLASFSGTGVETMRGMGQTRLLNGWG